MIPPPASAQLAVCEPALVTTQENFPRGLDLGVKQIVKNDTSHASVDFVFIPCRMPQTSAVQREGVSNFWYVVDQLAGKIFYKS